jgi:eukaryotic-like serine/threonine-protein kinase
MTIAPGTKVGRYEIRSQLGAGGMGEVYLAEDTRLHRKVALKILSEALASEQQRLQRFIQEAKAASALNHPHILTIYEIGATGALRFIATEFIDGHTVRELIHGGQTDLAKCSMWLRRSQVRSRLLTRQASCIVTSTRERHGAAGRHREST